jgi:hypothetical protein
MSDNLSPEAKLDEIYRLLQSEDGADELYRAEERAAREHNNRSHALSLAAHVSGSNDPERVLFAARKFLAFLEGADGAEIVSLDGVRR